MGTRFEGMTDITLDSYNVYRNNPCGGLDTSATLRAILKSISVGDSILVAEIQAVEDLNGAIVTGFEDAYTKGRVVISANGNYGPGASSVASPGIGRKVIGIGAYDIIGGALFDYSGRGPTSDGRFKPDVIMPSHTETSSNVGDNTLQIFTGTSGATPYGAGVAALYLNWFRYSGLVTEPGHVYAAIIASADRTYGSFDNNVGAGKVKMILGGATFWIGKSTVTTGNFVEINLVVPAFSTRKLNAAIWWPEYGLAHNDVDLSLYDNNGILVASSLTASSVWERISYVPISSFLPRTFKVRISGYSVPTSPQTVYYYYSN